MEGQDVTKAAHEYVPYLENFRQLECLSARFLSLHPELN